MKLKGIKHIIPSQRVNMGGIMLDQALPVKGVESVDPFLLIHHWSDKLDGGEEQKDVGVGPHPHRGFSPVTFIFKGSVHHRDSIGHDEIVEAGGTQWMNSGKGLIHSERPGKNLAKGGGDFEIIQFWVNSPASAKMKEPSYQPLSSENTKWYLSENKDVRVGIVAGEFNNLKSEIDTDSDLLILRIEMKAGSEIKIPVPSGYNSMVYSLDGELMVNDKSAIQNKDLVQFEKEEGDVLLKAKSDMNCILLSGAPINEPVTTYGPFVMNSQSELIQALNDYQNGDMGVLIENFD